MAEGRDPFRNIARFASAFADGRARRYFLQSVARELLPKERVYNCLRKTLGDPEVWFSPEFKKSHYARLVTCGSVWMCPVCAAKITERRRQELRMAEYKLGQKGITFPTFMGTFTAAHSRDDKYPDFIEYFNQAFRKLKSGRWWIRFEAEYGVVGSIAGTEPTWGEENGWHFHKHVDFFCTKPKDEIDPKELQAILAEKWAAILAKMGRYASQIYGVDVSEPIDTWDDYFAKWGISAEITKYPTKQGRKGYSPFELLLMAGAGEKWAADLFCEYAHAMKGKQQIVYSKGLKHILEMDLEPEKTDEQLAAEAVEVGDILLAILTFNQWRAVLANDARADLLREADSGDPGRVIAFLEAICEPIKAEVSEAV